MSRREEARAAHPTYGMLALFAAQDLAWTKRFSMQRHLAKCPACDAQVRAFRSTKQELRREAESETLTSFEAIADWSRLEREMIGNIAVGVSAARCIDRTPKRRTYFAPVLVSVGMVGVFALAWTTHIPAEQSQHIVGAFRSWWNDEGLQTGTVLRSSPGGITVRAQGTTLVMQHPRSAKVSLAGRSVVEARYVDQDTGQVTITSVYGQ